MVLFIIRLVFKMSKSIHIYSLSFLLSLYHICLSGYKCSVFWRSPDMSSLSLPVLVLLTLLRGNVLPYNFIIIYVVLLSLQDLVRICWLL